MVYYTLRKKYFAIVYNMNGSHITCNFHLTLIVYIEKKYKYFKVGW